MSSALTTSVGQVRIWDRFKNNELTEFWLPKHAFVSGISIVLGINIVNSISVTFDIPFEEGIELINTSIFSTGNLLAARVGYPDVDMMTPWFYGVLTQGGDGLDVTANGVGGSIVANTAPQQSFNEPAGDNKVEGKSLLDIIRSVAEKLGFVAEIGSDTETKISRMRDEKGPLIVYGNMNYWEILMLIANEYNVKFWLGVKDSGGKSVPTLFVLSDKDIMDGTPFRRYIMKGKFDLHKKEWPLLQWSPKSDPATWDGAMPDNAARGVKLGYVDDTTGEVETISLTPEEIQEYVHGVIAENKPEDKEIEGVKTDAAVSDREAEGKNITMAVGSDQQSKDVAEAKMMASLEAGSKMVQGSISTIGAPWEYPGNVIVIQGMGKRFDGSCMVDGITHIFTGGDFSTTLDVQRRGETTKGGQGDKTAGGEAPEKKV